MPRQPRSRLGEPEARILALRIAATFPGYKASTSQIKDFVPSYVHLTDIDLEASETRENECKWQQVAGNVISHQYSGLSIFTRGLAEKTDDGLKVTEAGTKFLDELDTM